MPSRFRFLLRTDCYLPVDEAFQVRLTSSTAANRPTLQSASRAIPVSSRSNPSSHLYSPSFLQYITAHSKPQICLRFYAVLLCFQQLHLYCAISAILHLFIERAGYNMYNHKQGFFLSKFNTNRRTRMTKNISLQGVWDFRLTPAAQAFMTHFIQRHLAIRSHCPGQPPWHRREHFPISAKPEH